jgi:hypothetical protein
MEKCHKLLCKIILFVQVVVKVVSHTAVPRFKILVALYQAVIVLPDLYGIEMPSGYCEACRLVSTPLHVCADAHMPSFACIQTIRSAGSKH